MIVGYRLIEYPIHYQSEDLTLRKWSYTRPLANIVDY